MAKKKNSISEQSLKIGSPEIGMLGKNDFSEDELENKIKTYLGLN